MSGSTPKTRPQPTATILQAEGARIGLVSCPLCGSAILLDPRAQVDAYEKHLSWHDEND